MCFDVDGGYRGRARKKTDERSFSRRKANDDDEIVDARAFTCFVIPKTNNDGVKIVSPKTPVYLTQENDAI